MDFEKTEISNFTFLIYIFLLFLFLLFVTICHSFEVFARLLAAQMDVSRRAILSSNLETVAASFLNFYFDILYLFIFVIVYCWCSELIIEHMCFYLQICVKDKRLVSGIIEC